LVLYEAIVDSIKAAERAGQHRQNRLPMIHIPETFSATLI